MATRTWTGSSGDWFSNQWITAGTLSSGPVAGDTALIEGAVTITAADAAVPGQGTLDGIVIEIAKAGTLVPTLDVSNEQFGSGIVIDTPFAGDNGVLVTRGTVGFAGVLNAEFTGNLLTLDIETSGTAALFSNTGTVEATGGGSFAVVGTTDAAFVNSGVLTASSSQVSVGTALTNSATGVMSATGGGTLALGGPVTNQGTIFASAAPGTTTYTVGTVTISGSLTNSGLLYAAPFADIAATGGVSNSGTITLAQQGTLTLGGGVTNAGQIEAQGGTLVGTGAVTNDAAGTIGAAGFATIALGGAVANAGSIFVSSLIGSLYSPGSVSVAGTLANSGSITVNPFGSLAANGGLANSGAITVSSGTLVLGGNADNAASVAIQGGTLAAGGVLTNQATGTIGVSSFGTLSATGTLINQGSLFASELVGGVYSPGTIDITGSLVNSGNLSAVYFGNVTAGSGVANSGTITDAGGTFALGGGVDNTSTIQVSAGTLDFSGAVSNSGMIGNSGGTLNFGGALANTGVISDTAGTITVAGSITGTGTIQLADHATLEGAVGTGQVIDFGTATDATLDLGNIGAFAGTIANLNGHDIIDINAPATATTYDPTSHILTVLNGTTAVGAFTILGGGTSLNATPDSSGGTVLTLQQIGSAAQVESYIVQNDFNTILPAPDNTPEPHGWPTPGAIVYYTFDAGSTLTAADEAGFLQAMSLYEDIANITFAAADTAHPADLFITTNNAGTAETTYAVVPSGSTDVATSATISIDTTVPGWQDLKDLGTQDTSGHGGYGFLTVLHELGHAIGFGHPGPYNDGGVSADFLASQIFYTDTRQYSVMSYIGAAQSGANYLDGNTKIYPQTPMLYDIGAAQMIYGANTAALTGNDTFGFNSTFGTSSTHPLAVYDFTQNTVPVVTLYDAGQNNTLDLSGFSAASYVNLNAGAFTSADGLTDNIAIAENTTINSAIGGPGNDVFTLNAFADTIDGGGGVNTVVINAPKADFTITGSAGTLTLTDTLTHVSDLLTGIQQLQFSDGVVMPCFARGTRILTARGDVPVQALRPGEDQAVTRDGRLAPIVWVGWRAFDAQRHPRPADVMPVRVRAGAIAPGQPRRDLLLSPDHALALDGVLIPVRYLINGATIVQETWHGRIAYFHVELDRHDVLLAEGLEAESFLDTGNRGAFADGSGVMQLHPVFAPTAADALGIWERSACAPLVTDGPLLLAARTRILARADALGHRITTDPALRLAAGGSPIPLRYDGARWSAALPPRAAHVQLLSRAWVPLHLGMPGDDARCLGVAVAGLQLDGAQLALDSPRLGAGWHAPESGWRWTSGAAELDVRGGRLLAFEIAVAGRYWISPVPPGSRRAG